MAKTTVEMTTYMIEFKNGKRHGEVIEVKPSKETTMEAARSIRDKAAVALNMFKWEAARKFCAAQGLQFRIVNETDIFHGSK